MYDRNVISVKGWLRSLVAAVVGLSLAHGVDQLTQGWARSALLLLVAAMSFIVIATILVFDPGPPLPIKPPLARLEDYSTRRQPRSPGG